MKQLLLFLAVFSILLSGCVQPNSTDVNTDGNDAPEIISINVDPVFVRVGTTTTVTVNATDPNGDALSYSWTVPLGDIIGSGHQVRYTAAFCCVGVNTVNVTVTDTKGASTSGSINIEVNP